jgi:UDP-glucose 4-epimerase
LLTHLNPQPVKPRRVVVLGAGGFIAGAVLKQLLAETIEVLCLGRPEMDLLSEGASERLADRLRPDDTLFFASAKAPVRNLTMLQENLAMVAAVCAALKKCPVAHVVYLSSDAVYRDSVAPLTEQSCAEPGSLHGVMHLAREIALRADYFGPLALVRPTLAYGLDDPHNGYGPNRFRRLAAEGKEIVLFGEGEERRDHVDVEDVAKLVAQVVLHKSVGAINAVSGELVSFRELAEFATASFSPQVAVKGSPRNGPMPHNGYRAFDNAAVAQAFPGFKFKSWREGVARMHDLVKAQERR